MRKNKPTSLRTRIKLMFLRSTTKLSVAQIIEILMEEDCKNPLYKRQYQQTIGSTVKKLHDEGFLKKTDLKTNRGGAIYQSSSVDLPDYID
jgi:hypothetical protein